MMLKCYFCCGISILPQLKIIYGPTRQKSFNSDCFLFSYVICLQTFEIFELVRSILFGVFGCLIGIRSTVCKIIYIMYEITSQIFVTLLKVVIECLFRLTTRHKDNKPGCVSLLHVDCKYTNRHVGNLKT